MSEQRFKVGDRVDCYNEWAKWKGAGPNGTPGTVRRVIVHDTSTAHRTYVVTWDDGYEDGPGVTYEASELIALEEGT